MWLRTAELMGSDSSLDKFGFSVAIEGDIALVGATWEVFKAGSGYIFERQDDGSWLETPTTSFRCAAMTGSASPSPSPELPPWLGPHTMMTMDLTPAVPTSSSNNKMAAGRRLPSYWPRMRQTKTC